MMAIGRIGIGVRLASDHCVAHSAAPRALRFP